MSDSWNNGGTYNLPQKTKAEAQCFLDSLTIFAARVNFTNSNYLIKETSKLEKYGHFKVPSLPKDPMTSTKSMLSHR